jgi:CheY-like chemotaxis protein/anti-sigma regulatory factor (Ser/Thr protein kinase)
MSNATVLVADRDAANREKIARALAQEGYEVVEVDDDGEALAQLKRTPTRFDVVMLERCHDSSTDSLDVLNKIKTHPVLKLVPVIMQSQDNDPRDLTENLRGGAHYYLTKPVEEELLLAVVKTAVTDHANYRSLQLQVAHCEGKLAPMQAGHFQIRTVEEAATLGKLLASAYPDADLVVVGLTELLINAIEHGNLEIGYEMKSTLIERGEWLDEVERRQKTPPYSQRCVDVMFQRQPGEIRLSIKDQGRGFDWGRYQEIQPDRVFDTHGRGIAIAKQVSFDEVEYQGDGSEVEAVNYYPEADHLGGINEY